ncbi:DDB1- and CUL4-associated factor 8 isoform X1 [Olea europaea subsp. europaea]|uniref:DDB1- and CUL4-associated factor 8 isoform X1 n=1 Tax=Olea europaea subsp. europaea TaxID=158383 RepID=A0A8S0RSC8_OLEEU|nr:DDB1- and CUL4-associated factor 8 isoform X1 [Olea europaea subsp. europaea]
MNVMRKRARTSMDLTIVDVWKREAGELSSRSFAHGLAASEVLYKDVVLRLDILWKLGKHKGCVSAVSFNAGGEILVSGSDDWMVILWDSETGLVRLSFHSGHHNNVFQAKIMPYTRLKHCYLCC